LTNELRIKLRYFGEGGVTAWQKDQDSKKPGKTSGVHERWTAAVTTPIRYGNYNGLARPPDSHVRISFDPDAFA
jgi:hypothetical protein